MEDLPLGNLLRAVVGFEQSRTPADVARGVEAPQGRLRSPLDLDLGRAFAAGFRFVAGGSFGRLVR